MREHLSQCASPPIRDNALRNVNKHFADRLRVNTTKTIHFGRLHIFMTSHFGTPQVISYLGRQGAKSGPPRLGCKMAFYALLLQGADSLDSYICFKPRSDLDFLDRLT